MLPRLFCGGLKRADLILDYYLSGDQAETAGVIVGLVTKHHSDSSCSGLSRASTPWQAMETDHL
jgi:hypothetical protein